MMKTVRLACLLLTFASIASYAEENQVRIGGGPTTGEYINIAKSLCVALGRLFQCEAIETSGTLDNKKRLEAGQVDIALAKGNIAEGWMKDAGFAAKYTVVRQIGDESLFVFGKPETLQAVGSWMGVRENASLLSIGLPGGLSGETALFDSLKNLPGSPLAKLEVKMYPNEPALVDAVKNDKVKLGFIAQIPNPNNILFTTINSSGLMMMGVVDPDMITLGDTFRIKSVTIKNAKWLGLGGVAQKIETANVSAAIVAAKPESLAGRASIVQQAAIKKIKDTKEADLLPRENWIQDLANTTSLQTGVNIENIMKSMESASADARARLEKLCPTKP